MKPLLCIAVVFLLISCKKENGGCFPSLTETNLNGNWKIFERQSNNGNGVQKTPASPEELVLNFDLKGNFSATGTADSYLKKFNHYEVLPNFYLRLSHTT